MSTSVLEIEDLRLEVPSGDHFRQVLCGVSLDIRSGEILGLVGESGSGKSITARAVLGMIPTGSKCSGRIEVDGGSMFESSQNEIDAIRAREVAMVFQDPRAHINPVRRIRDHMTEAAVSVAGMSRRAASHRAVELLGAVQIEDPQRIMKMYPHQLSGGMLQRVMIAGALMNEPKLLLADEPTTALDVTTQAEVMAILENLRVEFGLAILFITHDLELAAATTDRTAVMYAGRIVESQPSVDLHSCPLHPYTVGLLDARPGLGAAGERLKTIRGRPIAADEVEGGCPYASRCDWVLDGCRAEEPRLRQLDSVKVACLRAEEVRSGKGSHG
jgi:oligopeptide/dipeptide ABC transporter ATP-binding protein